MSDRAAILPPNRLKEDLEVIRSNNTVAFECDSSWEHRLMRSVSAEQGEHGEWRVNLPGDRHGMNLYTSGSTGSPKLVPKTIGNLLSEAKVLFQTFEWSDAPIVATVHPHHQYGLTFSLLLPWIGGFPWVDETPLYPQDILTLVQSTGAGTLISVPPQYKAMLSDKTRLPQVRCVSAAAPLAPEVAAAWLVHQSTEILEIYGCTEGGVIAYRTQVSGPGWRVFDEVTISTSDGLLVVASPFVSHAYGAEFQTADRIQQSGDGGFELLGRSDSIIKIGGKRVSLDGISQQLMACEGVLDAVAIAHDVNGLVRDKVIWAAVAVGEDAELDSRQLRRFLQGRLDSIEMPKRLVFVKELPRTANGKLPREKLAGLFDGYGE
jgi:acyl-coenzyme A synthetase/AMP-(fatty) acid ligase